MGIKKSLLRVCFLGLVCFIGLSGCTRYVDETTRRIETNLDEAELDLVKAKLPDVPESIDTVRLKNDIWLGDQSMKIMEGDPFPGHLEKEDSVTMVISKEATLPQLAQEITDMTGIPVRLDDLKASNSVPTESVPVNYRGKLSGLLNYLANRYSIWWRHKGGQITLFAKETRVFTVYALPTETTINASLDGASLGTGESNGSGNSSLSLSTSADLALWDSIEDGVRQVVGEDGTLSFSRVSGMVTVTASPYIVARVASYIAGWNERLSRQVAISVKVLQVNIANTDAYGIDLRAVFQSGKGAVGLGSPYFIEAGSSTTAAGAGLFSMALLDKSSPWKDSTAIMEAISTLGKTSLVTSSTVTTLNNKVAPVQVSTAQNYVKETTITTSGTGVDKDVEVSLETDTLNYGFTMEILPRILDHGRLIVLFSLTLSDLLALEDFQIGAGDQSEETTNSGVVNGATGNNASENDSSLAITAVQLPKMQIRGFMQEIAMRSGATLVLTGFERVQDTANTSGIGRPRMTIFGGREANENSRDVLVVLITPEVLESPLSPETRMRNF